MKPRDVRVLPLDGFEPMTMGALWRGSSRVIATGSMGQVPADQQANCIQNVCNSGDATGYWPAVAYPPAGAPQSAPSVVFRDIHFGFATDDFISSDLNFSVDTVST